MTLKHLQIFLTVCRENSITRAANVLFMSQPAVSLAIKEMEQYYNVKLFDRISHRLYLAAPGRAAMDYADSILHQYEEMEQVLFQQTFHESLSIGNSVGSTIFSALMKGIETAYPQIHFSVLTDHTATIREKVLRNECDVGLVEGIPAEPELECQVFAKEVMVVFSASSHPLAGAKGLRLADLEKERFLFRERFSGARIVTDTIFQAHGLQITPYWESAASLVLLDAVRLGIGISILPRSLVAPHVAAGTLSILDVTDAVFEYPYSIIYRNNKYQTRAFHVFCDYFIREAPNIRV